MKRSTLAALALLGCAHHQAAPPPSTETTVTPAVKESAKLPAVHRPFAQLAAVDVPELLVGDIRDFFGGLR